MNIPSTFFGYVVRFFQQLFDAMRCVVVPFTRFSLYDFFIGSLAIAFIGIAIKNIFKGDSTKHE